MPKEESKALIEDKPAASEETDDAIDKTEAEETTDGGVKEVIEGSDQKHDEKAEVINNENQPEELMIDDDDEEVITGDPQFFTALDRNNLYEQGVKFDGEGRKKKALKCFLAAIKDLSETNGLSFLPQCLRKIAGTYYETGDYAKAVQFIQAEKMYYETAIIDTSTLQRKLENEQLVTELDEGKVSEETISEKSEVVRADEYEKLAKMCLDKNQPQLALEYQGKATKMRQQTFGDDHPVTAKSLDFFTVVYAEVGKQQYSESMNKVDTENLSTIGISPDKDSGLRQRKQTNSADHQSEADALEETIRRREQEESITKIILWVFFIICFIVLGFIMSYIYCKIDVNNRSCATWRRDIHYYYVRFKYFFYTYISAPLPGVGK